MQNLVKKIDSDLQDGARVAIPEETTEINVSEGLINVNTVLNDGQLTEEEKSNLESSACNDNGCENQDGDDDGGNTPSANPVNGGDTDEEYVSNISIDIDNVSSRTGIAKAELQAICVGGNTSVAIPTDLPSLNSFIIINEGATTTAKALAENKVLAPAAREYFLKKSTELRLSLVKRRSSAWK